MARFHEQLTIGEVCRHDYSNAEARQPGDTVLVSADSSELPPSLITSMDPLEYAAILARAAPVPFRLKQEIVEFNIPDVASLILDHSIIENDLQLALEKLSGLIELELIDSIAQFEKQVGSPSEGITPDLVDVVDRMLFEMVDLPGSMHIVVDESGWEQISDRCGGKAATFDISTPSPEHQDQMLCNAAFHTDALALVTRKPQVNPTLKQLDVESDGVGLTVVVIPVPDSLSLSVRVIMLYAVGLFHKDLGVRIATIDTVGRIHAAAQPAGAGSVITQRHNTRQPTVTLDELRISLPTSVVDPNLTRLETIVESLSETIDDPQTRLLAATRIMTRADGLKPTDLIDACSRKLQRLDAALADFRSHRNARFQREVESREARIVTTDTQIESTRQLLADYHEQRGNLQAEIEQELTALSAAESAFNSDLLTLQSGTNALSADLTRIVTGRPRAEAKAAADGTIE